MTDKVVGEHAMRAKLRVSNVEKGNGYEVLHFHAVAANKYPEDGADENNTFARFSPSADMRLQVANPNLFDMFDIGDTFYVDFIRAPK